MKLDEETSVHLESLTSRTRVVSETHGTLPEITAQRGRSKETRAEDKELHGARMRLMANHVPAQSQNPPQSASSSSTTPFLRPPPTNRFGRNRIKTQTNPVELLSSPRSSSKASAPAPFLLPPAFKR